MNQFQVMNQFLRTYHRKARKLKNFIHRERREWNRHRSSVEWGLSDIKEDIQGLIQGSDRGKLFGLFDLFRDSIGGSFTISYSYWQYFKKAYLQEIDKSFLQDPTHQKIVKSVKEDSKITDPQIDIQDIFHSVFLEIDYWMQEQEGPFPFKKQHPPIVLVLISGVFNELFKNAAFHRAAKYCNDYFDIPFVEAKVSGISSSSINSDNLRHSLDEIREEYPEHKMWLFSYSKGGLDALHFLKDHQDFARNHIHGLSTVASPIVGTEHDEHFLLKKFNQLANFKAFQFIDQQRDLFRRDFQQSLSSKYQGVWFRRNYKKLPIELFYTSVALQSDFQNSHFWMMLTKLLFKNMDLNDGIVEAHSAQFPHYFWAMNFGVLDGHHLSAYRSSSFNQEALLLSHLVVLNYFEKFSTSFRGA